MARVDWDVTEAPASGSGYAKVVAALLARDSRTVGNDFICPSHDDQRPSLGVTDRDGKVLLYCSAGCSTRDVMKKLGLPMSLLAAGGGPSATRVERIDPLPDNRSIWKWMRALKGEPLEYWTERRGIAPEVLERYEVGWNAEAKSTDGSDRVGAFTFPYRDASGRLVNVKRRWQATSNHSKTFRLNRGAATGFLWPPDQLEHRTIVLAEGEPDVLRLISLGIPAVTGITGVGGAAKSARVYAPVLKGKRVYVAFDSSAVGRSTSAEVARTISTYADEVYVFDPFPGRSDDSDLCDWFTFHGDDVKRFKRELKKLTAVDRIDELPTRAELFVDGTFNPVVLGKIAEQVGHLRVGPGKSLWRYRDGVYAPDGETWLGGFVREALQEEFRESRFREVKAWCRSNTSDTIPFVADDQFINCQNGLFDWRRGRLEAHSPDVPTVTQINARYVEGAECRTIDRFLQAALPEEVVDWWWEWVGYLLIPTAKYQRALMVHGPGDTGKSTLLRLLGTFLGPDATVHHTLQALCDDRFAKADLYGKLANIHADLDARSIQSSGTMKVLVSGDSIRAERKYQDSFTFEPYARHVYSANELPGTSDQSDAYYKRWFIIPMTNKVPLRKQEPLLEERMTTPRELSGMLNRALEGLARLEKRKRFDEPDIMKRALARYRQDTDTVIGWASDRLKHHPRSRLRLSDAFFDYSQWCLENNRRPYGRQKFREHFEATHPEVPVSVVKGYQVFRDVQIGGGL